MFSKSVFTIKNKNFIRNFHVSIPISFKVAVLGAAGGIGQPLSLLMKVCPMVTELSMYDIAPHILGVAKDLSHIETPCKVKGYKGVDNIPGALKGCDIVLIPAGMPRKPGMTRDDLFSTNASIIKDLAEAFAETCPKAMLGVITNPVNSTLPIAAEMLKIGDCYNPKKVFGVTTLDIVRASTFIAELKNLNPEDINCPVIAGHSGHTIVPVLSQVKPKIDITEEEAIELNRKIQEAGTEVVKAKAGYGSATLAMAFAGARFAISLMKGMKGEKNIIECAFVESNLTESKYFSTPLLLGKNGLEENLGLPPLNDFEKKLVERAMQDLLKQIKKGEDFAHN